MSHLVFTHNGQLSSQGGKSFNIRVADDNGRKVVIAPHLFQGHITLTEFNNRFAFPSPRRPKPVVQEKTIDEPDIAGHVLGETEKSLYRDEENETSEFPSSDTIIFADLKRATDTYQSCPTCGSWNDTNFTMMPTDAGKRKIAVCYQCDTPMRPFSKSG